MIRPGLMWSVAACALAYASVASADTIQPVDNGPNTLQSADARNDDVLTRPRQDYDAKGLPLGAFRLFPTLAVGVSADDNIFRQTTGEESDVIYGITARAVLKSTWSRHFLELHAGTDTQIYSDHSSENVTNWNVGTTGKIDVQRSLTIFGDAEYYRDHEDRSSPDSPGFAAEPTSLQKIYTATSIRYQPNRLILSAGASFDRFEYDPVALIGGGSIDNSDRDRDRYSFFAKAAYEFSPGTAAFVRLSYEDRKFDETFDRSGFQRDSNGYAIDAGVDMTFGHLIRGRAFIGYISQRYIAPLPDVKGFDFGAQLDWFVTPLTTVRLLASRQINDTTIFGASAEDDRRVSLVVDHELLRNVLLHGDVGYTDGTFEGAGREDRTIMARAGVKYLLNRYLSADATYAYRNRDSNTPTGDYTDNVFSINITGHL